MLERLSQFLKNHLLTHQCFLGRTFYGEAFALAFFAERNELTDPLRSILFKCFHRHDVKADHFHWEFNRYALLHYERASGDLREHPFVVLGGLRKTKATNWQLLKQCIDYRADEVKKLLKKMQDESGFILDEKAVHSFHYHAFSLSLLGEIYEAQKDLFLKEAFLKGLEMIRPFILQNGESLMIGRGQKQLFGMGALLDALATGYQLTKDDTLVNDFYRLWNYIESFFRADGSLPLVLREGVEGPPNEVDLFDERYLGWYSYNNYFDYLPFFAYFANRAQLKIKKMDSPSYPTQNFMSRFFLKVAKPTYEAIVARPGGLTTNDLPFPYIVTKGGAMTPLCGGEQFAPSPYLKENLSLPYFPWCGKTIRAKSFSKLCENALYMVSPLGYLKREYVFEKRSIFVQTSVISPFSCMNQFAFFDDFKQVEPTVFKGRGCSIVSSSPLTYLRSGVTATGKIALYGTWQKHVGIKVLV